MLLIVWFLAPFLFIMGIFAALLLIAALLLTGIVIGIIGIKLQESIEGGKSNG